jgi:diguanylate cyclase (GGDEF)-like protein
MDKRIMTEAEIHSFDTEFAPAERLGQEGLLRQHQAWSDQLSMTLISNAIPDLLLILNEYRQIVYANNYFKNTNHFSTLDEYIGQRPGELLGCVYASITEGGCGTTSFCSRCGAVNAILMSLSGKKDVEECQIERGKETLPLDLRVWTTPAELNHEKFTIFAFQDISIEKENGRLLEEVQKLAILDPLTEIYNRRVFFDMATHEIIRSIRYHNPFSVIMIDLDRFKQVNDTYGHPAGDALIKEVVKLIQINLREIDTFARYGGDEFIILLPETGLVGGQKVANRIMSAGDVGTYLYKDFEIPMSFSAGVAEFIFEEDHDIDDVISRADQDLYQVKNKRSQLLMD